jgi:hypothetical protein
MSYIVRLARSRLLDRVRSQAPIDLYQCGSDHGSPVETDRHAMTPTEFCENGYRIYACFMKFLFRSRRVDLVFLWPADASVAQRPPFWPPIGEGDDGRRIRLARLAGSKGAGVAAAPASLCRHARGHGPGGGSCPSRPTGLLGHRVETGETGLFCQNEYRGFQRNTRSPGWGK